jgi:hypothetical protein
MAIPTSGSIALTALQTEFGGSNPIGINEYYRGGGLVPDSSVNSSVPTSGAVSMSNFYGAQNRNTISITISSNTNNYNLFSNLGGGYIAGLTDVVVTINNGVTIGSSSTGSPAFTVSGFTSGDTVSITNNGTIVGRGGTGGTGGIVTSGGAGTAGSSGSNGGNALSISFATSITNNGTIAGGGGAGGGGGGARYVESVGIQYRLGGGGGGGGAGSGSGGSGGVTGTGTYDRNGSNGNAGSSSSAGNGGAGATPPSTSNKGGNGGTGGGLGASGSTGSTSVGTNTASGGSGGSAGNYISGNSNVTWIADGTKLGGSS